MIKTIIFDFAGVVTKEGFRKGLIKQLKLKYTFDEIVFNQRFLEYEDPYMSGKTDSRYFWKMLCQDFGIPYKDFAYGFTHCYEFNPDMVKLIKTLKGRYKVIMLSDNFDILSDAMKSDPVVQELFEKVFYSNEIGMIKKDPRAFELVLKNLNLKADECLFIDDKEHNLEPAKILGFNTIHFTDVGTLKQALVTLGISW